MMTARLKNTLTAQPPCHCLSSLHDLGLRDSTLTYFPEHRYF